MDCYIVRIYRHEVENPREFVGVVEEVGTEGKRAFSNIDDLWEILNTSSESTKKKVKTKGRFVTSASPLTHTTGAEVRPTAQGASISTTRRSEKGSIR